MKNPLLTGSLILLLGNMIANVCSYLYHLLMGRMLGPIDYGVLESMISLIYLMSIPIGTVSLVIVKYVSQYKGESRIGAIGKFYQKINQGFLLFSVIIFGLFSLLASPINSFLRLPTITGILMVDAIFLVGIFLGTNRSFLQGISSFFPLSISIVLEGFGKLFLAVILVFFGFKVNGALGAILITGIISLLISRYLLKDKINIIDNQAGLDKNGIIKFAGPAFIISLSMTSIYTMDVILVRHFLPAFEAGLYSALAVLGKIIFFASSPIAMVMFPLISERHIKGEKFYIIFQQSLAIVSFICLTASIIYFLFPQIILKTLYGDRYLAASSYLGLFAVFLSLYSLANLFLNYFLSIKKGITAGFSLFAAVLQISLIFIFHQNLEQIITVSIVVNCLLLFSLVLYYWKDGKH